ncbi:alpha/beta-hydrolase [Lentinus brumalis]|uniref:Alpha/beta-hydrolase n=1 Tax=Lentinus brumalis TaxID=2498619 RepID=A0A371DBG8_9APHY|nr:alpha/beta-hydrolase [Polyporus brumalis]
MIGHSWSEYVFIRLCILGLRSIAPLSILYSCLSWYNGHLLYSRWLGIYAVAEAAFYLLVFIPRNRLLQRDAAHPPLPPREVRETLFAKCFARMRDTEMATGWFFSARPDGIKRENMVEWILWAIFGTHREGLKEEWMDEIEDYMRKIEELLGRKVEEGWDQTVRCMKVSLDPVDTVHRPLFWYFLVAVVDTITAIDMMRAGFRHYTSGNWTTCFPPRIYTAFSNKAPHPELVYWLRPHRSPHKDPILFLHGIGIGLWPYRTFFNDLIEADPNVGIIAIENLSISMRISKPPLSRTEMLEALTELLDAHDIPRVVVAAHSYGTVIAAHMLRDPQLSKRVSSYVLIDPIPFLLHLPAVAHNFVYRQPRTANEWQLWYFASRDPDVARALARHFFWAENILWKEDLEGHDVAVVLSGRDQIVDAKEVWQYLTGEQIDAVRFRWEKDRLRVLYYPELDHAQVFDTKERRRPFVQIALEFTARKKN